MARDIIDDIDRALARRHGFTDKERIFFIINGDIQYRMGREEDQKGERG